MKAILGTALALGAALTIGLSGPARAEADTVRFARQFSMGYIQFNLIDKFKLLEKHGKELGLTVKSELVTFSGPNAVNDALLSGSVEVGGGGVPGGLTIWAKSRGEVKGIAAFSSQPFFLLTNNPAINSIKDFQPTSRIALPAIKVSIQAVVLEMAAAQAWGESEWGKLDPITISLPPPDQEIGLKTGGSNFDTVFSVPPYQYSLMKAPGIRSILSSYDVLGPSTFTMSWASAKFRNANPKTFLALVAALKEATDMIHKDPQQAAQAWIDDTKSKLSVEEVAAMIAFPGVEWTLVPQETKKYADFMVKTGVIKTEVKSWKDYFFPEIHDMPGS